MKTQKQVRKILLDFGGVVVENGFRNWVDTLTSDSEEKQNFGALIDQADKGAIAAEECFQKLAELSKKTVEKVKDELFAAFKLKEGVVEIIKKLRSEGYSLVLVTNFMKSMADGLLDHHGLRSFFEKIFISSEMGLSKPSPEFFKEVIKQLGINNADALFIDDSEKNIQTAMQEGIDSCLFQDEEKLKLKLQEWNILPQDFEFEHLRRPPVK